MATRSCVLFIGDTSMLGTRPSSELAGINPSYDDVQTDAFIWNDGAAAWQNYQAGTNSSPTGSFWGPEARFREAIRANKPTGNVYFIKHAVDSSLQSITGKVSWNPLVTGEAFSALIAKITAAASAAGGDTLRFDLCVVSIYTEDAKLAGSSQSFGRDIWALIDAIRKRILTISGCSLGTMTGLWQMPAIVLEPAYAMSGLSEEEQLNLHLSRGSINGLDYDSINQCLVHRTSRYPIAADGKTYNAAGLVALGEDLAKTIFYSTPTYAATEAPVFTLMGDSIHEGTGANAELPTQLTGALTGARIFNTRNGSLETLQAGANNQVTLPPILGLHGLEIPLAGLLRARLNDLWIVKATSVGSRAFMWSPINERYFWHSFFKPWLLNTIDQLRVANKKPMLQMVAVSLGTNDVFDVTVDLASTRSSLEYIIDATKTLVAQQNLPTAQMKFVLCMPAETISPNTARVAAVRAAITEIAEKRNDVVLVDMNGIATIGDGIHPNATGNAAHALQVFNAWQGATSILTVKPTFAPSREALVKALRLSAVRPENDGYAMIDSAIQTVAIGFRKALGSDRVSTMANLPFLPNPGTETEHLRMLAYQTEIKWVRANLLRTMPTLFMDGTARLQTWNDEAAFRETSYLQTRDELRRLEEEVSQALDTLKSATLVSTGSSLSVQLVQPDDRISPGDTVRAI